MARYIGVILLTALVLWTGEARGACAWVLWVDDRMVRSDGSSSLGPLIPYESKAECEEEAKKSNDHEQARSPKTTNYKPTYYQCWPDTVDPRAPKGVR